MITIIIGIILGIILGIYYTYKECEYKDFIFYFLNSLISVVILGFLCYMIAFILPYKTEMKLTAIYQLESFQDNNNIEGSFFLGCGHIDGRMKYVFYYQTDNGYKMGQLSYNKVFIKYSNELPKIESYSEVKTDSFINLFSINVLHFERKYIIYIPKGTIKKNFNLDSK
jgi:ABC-type proline/glycine betaine transport system permease subunit